MASFRIHEDQENRIRTAPLKENVAVAPQQKRSVLGAIDNKQARIGVRPNKPLQNVIVKPGDENAYIKPAAKKPPMPAVPVAQFEAFKVYEDKNDDVGKDDKKEDKENAEVVPKLCEVVSVLSKENIVNVVLFPEPSQDENEGPGEKSATVKDEYKTLRTRSERQMFFEMEEYRLDIYKYLRAAEMRHRPKPGYMRKQQDITYSMRTILVDWLVEVAEEYGLHSETLCLAVSYIDRFLSFMSVVRAKLQLVGTAAMFIAAKYEEIYPPEVGEFVYITDDTYTKKQVLRMEQLILKVLAFDLSNPTPLAFVKKFCAVNNYPEKMMFFAEYLSELSLLEADPFLQFLPSMIAASAVALARFTLNEEPWPVELKKTSSYTFSNLAPCIKHLETLFRNAPQMPQHAIQDKYASAKYQAVATVAPRAERLVTSMADKIEQP